MRRALAPIIAVASLLTLQSNAIAGSAGEALNEFGLIGSWSLNCAQNPNDSARAENGVIPTRWVYASSDLSNPTLVIYRHDPSLRLTSRFEIKSAVKITADKIKYTQIMISSKANENPEIKYPNAQLLTTVVQKVNDKITVLSQVGDDGTVYAENGLAVVRQPINGQMVEINRVPYGFLEKCLD
jgi:hypothetical protein